MDDFSAAEMLLLSRTEARTWVSLEDACVSLIDRLDCAATLESRSAVGGQTARVCV